MKTPAVLILGSIMALSGSSAFAQVLTHDYTLDGTLADSLGGPSLVSLGGTVTPTGYTFAADQGLTLSSAVDSDDYSIELNFNFADTSGYRKIVDFQNLTSDTGLYNLNTDINFYNSAFGPTGVIQNGTAVDVILTRDGTTGQFSAYVDGTQEITFNDSTGLADFSQANNIINFFVDDSVTGGREASAGEVTNIKIWDGALTAAQITSGNLPGAVPDLPNAAGLMTFAMLGLGGLQRYFRRTSK